MKTTTKKYLTASGWARFAALVAALAACLASPLSGEVHAAADAAETAMSQHFWAVIQLAETNRPLAVKQTLEGLEKTPTQHVWGIELAAIFASDERAARGLRGAARVEHFAGCRDYLRRGLALAEAALRKKPGDESLTHQAGEITGALALANLETGETTEAKKLARQRLAANTDAKDWNHGNVIHDANSLLGRAALRDGDKPAAAAFLLAAGATPGSPQLNSFGPNFRLAREVLEAGDAKTVLAYLDLVEKFWVTALHKQVGASAAQLSRDHATKLDEWRKEIRADKVPAEW